MFTTNIGRMLGSSRPFGNCSPSRSYLLSALSGLHLRTQLGNAKSKKNIDMTFDVRQLLSIVIEPKCELNCRIANSTASDCLYRSYFLIGTHSLDLLEIQARSLRRTITH